MVSEICVVFPSDYFDKKKPDEMFVEQAQLFSSLGIPTATISIDDLQQNQATFYPKLPPNKKVLYRGWMVTAELYKRFVQVIINNQCLPFTSTEEYMTCHLLPNWYPYISELTPKTKCFETSNDLEAQLTVLNWQKFFVKDYVKSLKTSIGSIIDSPSKINLVLAEMQKFKGDIEGGICVRQLEDFDTSSEKRYFIINKKAYSGDNEIIPDIVTTCAELIPSSFFSVDVIRRNDGILRIVEVGDGQVSDLVGWSTDAFVQLWLS
jgi:hypothetical protein